MKTFKYYVTIAFCICLIQLHAQTLDVNFTGNTGNCGNYLGFNENSSPGQSFTAGISGKLTKVKVGLSTQSCTETNVINCIAKIYDGTCTGTLLTSENFSIPTGYSLNMFEINFSTPAIIISGQVYTLVLSTISGQACNSIPFPMNVRGSWHIENPSNCGGEYAGGTSYENNCSPYPSDFYIQTYVSIFATGTDTQTACNSFTWIDGNTYTSSNNTATYNIVGGAANGIDSLVTLNLTIINSATGIDTQTACNSFTWIDGNTYTSSNNTATYNIVGGAVNGCDSLVTLNLTIINSATGTDTQTACNLFTWIDGNTYTSSNNTATYNIVGGAVNGCDSLVTLNLTINKVSDLSTTTNGTTITANNANATYQWLDCDNNYNKITDEIQKQFTATANGNYAAELTENNCVDTTECITINSVGILESNLKNEIHAYPNPTKGKVYISSNSNKIFNAELYTNTSKILNKYYNVSCIDLSKYPTGEYIIKIESSGEIKTFIIKKD